MEKPPRRVKKVARKSLLNTKKSTKQAEKSVPAIPINISSGWREEEDLLDYEQELQPCFSPAGELSEPENRLLTPIPEDNSSSCKFGRRFCPAMGAYSAVPKPKSWSGDELSSGIGVRSLFSGSDNSPAGEKHGWSSDS
jgi:hypothetical protein